MTPQETDAHLPGSVQESPAEAGVAGGAPGLGAPSVAVHAGDLLKEAIIFFITSTTVWPQVKQQGGNTAPLINRQLD